MHQHTFDNFLHGQLFCRYNQTNKMVNYLKYIFRSFNLSNHLNKFSSELVQSTIYPSSSQPLPSNIWKLHYVDLTFVEDASVFKSKRTQTQWRTPGQSSKRQGNYSLLILTIGRSGFKKKLKLLSQTYCLKLKIIRIFVIIYSCWHL